jgi:hypothetical protein
MPNADEIPVLLNALKPIYGAIDDGEAKMTAYLQDTDNLAAAKKMLTALDLISTGADGQAQTVGVNERAEKTGRCKDPLVVLQNTVASSLTAALEKQVAKMKEEVRTQKVEAGMTCVRNNCNVEYVDETQEYNCTHCPGGPVFHEGYKFWSCCEKKKHYDFDSFLAAPGCATKPGCKWFKEASDELKAKQCRYDFFQTPSTIVVTVFAKLCEPGETVVKLNADTLEVTTVYQQSNTFALKVDLFDEVVVEECKVNLMSTKIDITLKKAGGTWEKLEA